jgi:hypothetical protein
MSVGNYWADIIIIIRVLYRLAISSYDYYYNMWITLIGVDNLWIIVGMVIAREFTTCCKTSKLLTYQAKGVLWLPC